MKSNNIKQNDSEKYKEFIDELREIIDDHKTGIQVLTKTSRFTAIRCVKNTERIEDNENQLKWFDFQIKELRFKKESLKKPKGMIGGIIIFSLFSIMNIIIPLIVDVVVVATAVLSAFNMNNHDPEYKAEWIVNKNSKK